MVIVVPDIAAKVRTKIGDGLEVPPMDDIGLEAMKERLHMGVLVRRATTGHALSDAMFHQNVTERASEELAAPIAMEDQAGTRPTPSESGLHRPPCKARIPNGPQPPGKYSP